jgi:hypothetical protein
MRIYWLVMAIKPWASLELQPQPASPFAVSLEPASLPGIGFVVVFKERAEAEAFAAGQYEVRAVRGPRDRERED